MVMPISYQSPTAGLYGAEAVRPVRAGPLLADIGADLSGGGVTGAGVDTVDARVGVEVDVGAAGAHRVDEIRERVSRERPDEACGRDRALREDAVCPTRAERAGDGRGGRIEQDDDRAVPARRLHVDVRHEDVVDVRGDQLVLERVSVLGEVEDRLRLALRVPRRAPLRGGRVIAPVPVEPGGGDADGDEAEHEDSEEQPPSHCSPLYGRRASIRPVLRG